MVEGQHTTALIDCGPSSLISMKQRGVSPSQVDVILLTHLHGDHFGGIPFFLLDAAFGSGRSTPLIVAGPPGAKQRIRDAQEVLFPTSSTLPWRYELDIIEIEPGKTHCIRDLEVTPLLMDHPSGAPSTGLRVACDHRVVSYTGDTQWNDNIIALAKNADLFIAETYTMEVSVAHHMTYQRWVDERDKLSPKRFIATHMSDEVLARIDELDCDTAHDGLVIAL